MDALPETKKLAPGPIPFPMFGNIPHFGIGVFQGKTVVQLMSEWKKRYGPAMTVWLGPVPAIFVTDYDLAMDLFVKQGDAFVDRLKPPVFAVARKGLGIVMAEGDLWVEQRRFALHTLRNFGLGRNLMQVRILAEFHKQMAPIERQLEANGGTAKVDPRRMFNLLIGSIINSLLVGITYDEDNCEEFMTLRKKIESMANKIGLVNFFLEKIPVIGRGFDDIVNVQLDVFDHLKGLLHKRKQQIESGEYSLENGPQDYMDAYLLEIKNRTEANMGYFRLITLSLS
ncbi:hypothetical protein L596_024011 [Steinernema carpocapsae]|uniref:Cytochrome P450 n=1 Tax=Steinernema carpocapsae TaxID=34508 RepID=A0A4U5MFF7_STECR|nr:hypothetical protein L596_024011 [Steinernema carpocapsae]